MSITAHERRANMTSDRVPTSVQIAVHVLVRGLPLPEGVNWRLEGYQVLITGPARASDWRNEQVERGDLEAILWCAPREAPSVVENLQASLSVVAVRFEGAP